MRMQGTKKRYKRLKTGYQALLTWDSALGKVITRLKYQYSLNLVHLTKELTKKM